MNQYRAVTGMPWTYLVIKFIKVTLLYMYLYLTVIKCAARPIYLFKWRPYYPTCQLYFKE